MLQPTYGTDAQGFQVEEPNAGEQKAVLPAQCNQLRAIRSLRLDCFSDMKVFPPGSAWLLMPFEGFRQGF